jgi:hypothetical protein
MNKNDFIIEVRQEIAQLVHRGKEQRFKDTDSSIEFCYDSKMSVDEAVKTFF